MNIDIEFLKSFFELTPDFVAALKIVGLAIAAVLVFYFCIIKEDEREMHEKIERDSAEWVDQLQIQISQKNKNQKNKLHNGIVQVNQERRYDNVEYEDTAQAALQAMMQAMIREYNEYIHETKQPKKTA